MVRRDSGPLRSDSVDAYLRGTRALAAIALLAFVGAALSDALAGRFWADHALLAGLVASVIVVMLTVALVNEGLERRSRQRCSVPAQYVMLQLVRDARIVWTGVAELAGLMPAELYAAEGDLLAAATTIDAGSSAVHETERLTAALRDLVAQEPVKYPAAPPTRSNHGRGLQRSVRQLLGDHAGKFVVDLDVKL